MSPAYKVITINQFQGLSFKVYQFHKLMVFGFSVRRRRKKESTSTPANKDTTLLHHSCISRRCFCSTNNSIFKVLTDRLVEKVPMDHGKLKSYKEQESPLEF